MRFKCNLKLCSLENVSHVQGRLAVCMRGFLLGKTTLLYIATNASSAINVLPLHAKVSKQTRTS